MNLYFDFLQKTSQPKQPENCSLGRISSKCSDKKWPQNSLLQLRLMYSDEDSNSKMSDAKSDSDIELHCKPKKSRKGL